VVKDLAGGRRPKSEKKKRSELRLGKRNVSKRKEGKKSNSKVVEKKGPLEKSIAIRKLKRRNGVAPHELGG